MSPRCFGRASIVVLGDGGCRSEAARIGLSAPRRSALCPLQYLAAPDTVFPVLLAVSEADVAHAAIPANGQRRPGIASTAREEVDLRVLSASGMDHPWRAGRDEAAHITSDHERPELGL